MRRGGGLQVFPVSCWAHEVFRTLANPLVLVPENEGMTRVTGRTVKFNVFHRPDRSEVRLDGKRTFILLASLIDYIKSHETVASPEAVKSGSHRLATSARAISRHSRVDLRTAAVRLATRVAETPNISK